MKEEDLIIGNYYIRTHEGFPINAVDTIFRYDGKTNKHGQDTFIFRSILRGKYYAPSTENIEKYEECWTEVFLKHLKPFKFDDEL